MRILIINYLADYTGSPLALLRLIRLLKESNPDYCFDFLLLHDGPLHTDFQKNGKVYVLGEDKILTKISKRLHCQFPLPLRLRFSLSRYGCIFANTVCSIPEAIKIKHKINSPVVAYIHEREYLMRFFDVKEAELKDCDSIFAVSSTVVDDLNRNYHVPISKMQILPSSSNFVDRIISSIVHFPYEDGKYDRPFIVGMSFSAVWGKSADIIPLIIKILFDRHADMNCHFIWIGHISALYKMQIEFELKKMGLQDKLTIIGPVDDPVPYYLKFDVNLFPSKEDSFSLATQEVAAMGIPSIWFKGCNGLEDWFPEDNWLTVPYMDLECMCDKIYALYADREKLDYYGKMSRKIIEDNIHKTTDVSELSKMLSA